MAGFRDFQTGEVLTAANVNDFLGKQAVMKFADASARDTALGTAVGGANALREGMVAYLDDTDEVLFYDGASWGAVGLPLGTATPTDGQILAFGTATSTWNPTDGGGLVAVKYEEFTGTQSASVASDAAVDITDLAITHTLSDAANRLILIAMVVQAGSVRRLNTGLRITDDGTVVTSPTSPGNRNTALTAFLNTDEAGSSGIPAGGIKTETAVVVHSPGDTSAHDYKVQIANLSSGTQTAYVNRTEADADNSSYMRAVSTFMLMEVKV